MRISDWSSDVCSSDLDMNMRLLFGDGQHVLRRELVPDTSDRDLVARDLLRREDDGVVRLQLDLMAVCGHARERGARFGLCHGCGYSPLAPRTGHRVR